jgi:hypothetical protein
MAYEHPDRLSVYRSHAVCLPLGNEIFSRRPRLLDLVTTIISLSTQQHREGRKGGRRTLECMICASSLWYTVNSVPKHHWLMDRTWIPEALVRETIRSTPISA